MKFSCSAKTRSFLAPSKSPCCSRSKPLRRLAAVCCGTSLSTRLSVASALPGSSRPCRSATEHRRPAHSSGTSRRLANEAAKAQASSASP